MREGICIVGGKLQGMEAAYLAGKAGYEVMLIDKAPEPPAAALADEFYRMDVLKDLEATKTAFRRAAAVLPALEDEAALATIVRASRKAGVPCMHDEGAFLKTSRKDAFSELCRVWGLPQPARYPMAKFPMIVKPVVGSGSRGVALVRNRAEMQNAVGEDSSKWMIQECVNGIFLSLELLGMNGEAMPFQVTCLEFDETYGCKRVLAPSGIGDGIRDRIEEIGDKLVKGLDLKGVTDLQVALRSDNSSLDVIEANARLPSQTPTVVFHSAGENLVALLADIFINSRLPKINKHQEKGVIYQHLLFGDGTVRVAAEHNIAHATGLRIETNFHGADEAITNLPQEGSAKGYVATLIIVDSDLSRAKIRMEEATESLCEHYKVFRNEERSPFGMTRVYDKIEKR